MLKAVLALLLFSITAQAGDGPWTSCVESLCSDSKQVHTVSQWMDLTKIYSAETSYGSQTFEAEVRPAIEKFYDDNLASEIQNLKDLKEGLKQPPSIPSKDLHFYRVLVVLGIYGDTLDQANPDPNKALFSRDAKGHISIISSRLKERLAYLSLKPADLDNLISTLSDIFTYNLTDLAVYFYEPLQVWIKQKHPALSLADGLKFEVKEMREHLDSIEASPGLNTVLMKKSFEESYPKALANRALQGQPLTPEEGQELSDAIGELAMLSDLITQEKWKEVFSKVDYFDDLMASAQVLHADQKIQSLINELENSDKANALKHKIMENCRQNFAVNFSELPSLEQIEAAKSMIADAKARVNNSVLSRFSESAQNLIFPDLMAATFEFPPSSSEYLKSFLANTQEAASDLTGDQTERRAFGNDIEYFLFSKATNLFSLPLDTPEDHVSSVTDICDGQSFPLLSDATYTTTGTIEISWMSVRDLMLGKGVVAHELGHILQHSIDSHFANLDAATQKDYEAAMSCSVNNHFNLDVDETPGILKILQFKPSETLKYVQEDWADLVSATAADPADTPLFCVMQNSFGNTDLENSNPSDPHSDPLYRLLRMETFRRGALPEACLNAMLTNKSPLFFQSCLESIPRS